MTEAEIFDAYEKELGTDLFRIVILVADYSMCAFEVCELLKWKLPSRFEPYRYAIVKMPWKDRLDFIEWFVDKKTKYNKAYEKRNTKPL